MTFIFLSSCEPQIIVLFPFFCPTAEFQEEDIEPLEAKGHTVERVEVLSLVEGTRRTNDLIIGVKDPRSQDASALTMSSVP